MKEKSKVSKRLVVRGVDIFTAPEVARLVNADLKTVHNWVLQGKISAYRTPGRHLRFLRKSVLKFLYEYNYPVPEWLKTRKGCEEETSKASGDKD